MSEVIEDFIRRNAGMAEIEAFHGFLQQERIKTWVGTDEARRERLRREFSRVWATLHPPATPSRQGSLVREVPRPAPPPESRVNVQIQRTAPPDPAEEAIRRSVTAPAKRLHVLCPTCGKLDVWLSDGSIACRTCSHIYEDMLQLIPVRPVGPFTFLFGEGLKGWLVAGGILLGLFLLYEVLRWG